MLFASHTDIERFADFDVSEQVTTVNLYPYCFVFEVAPASADQSASALSVVGMHTYIDEYHKLPDSFIAVVNHTRTHPTIRARPPAKSPVFGECLSCFLSLNVAVEKTSWLTRMRALGKL